MKKKKLIEELRSILWGFLYDFKVERFTDDDELVEKTLLKIIKLLK